MAKLSDQFRHIYDNETEFTCALSCPTASAMNNAQPSVGRAHIAIGYIVDWTSSDLGPVLTPLKGLIVRVVLMAIWVVD